MITRASTGRIDIARPILVVLAVAALVVSFFAMARPTLADGTVINLKESQENTSSDSQTSQDDCGEFGNTGSGVVWHFILNGLDEGTAAGSLTASFEDAGSIGPQTADAVNADGKTQHFYVFTPTADTLITASAVVDTASDGGQLVLSHVCKQSGGQSQSTSASASQSVEQSVSASQSSSQSAEQSVEGNTGTPEQSVAAETGTPAASIGSGAISSESGATAIPVIAFAVLMLVSLGGLAAVNLAAVRRNR